MLHLFINSFKQGVMSKISYEVRNLKFIKVVLRRVHYYFGQMYAS